MYVIEEGQWDTWVSCKGSQPSTLLCKETLVLALCAASHDYQLTSPVAFGLRFRLTTHAYIPDGFIPECLKQRQRLQTKGPPNGHVSYFLLISFENPPPDAAFYSCLLLDFFGYQSPNLGIDFPVTRSKL